MRPLDNDRWRGAFDAEALGLHHFTVRAGVDRFATWQHDLWARWSAGQDPAAELEIGTAMLATAARRAAGPDRAALHAVVDLLAPPAALGAEADPALLSCLVAAGTLAGPGGSPPGPVLAAELVTGPALAGLVARYRVLRGVAGSPVLSVRVDPVRARFSTWYEMFPRSASPLEGHHGTFADVEARLDYVAAEWGSTSSTSRPSTRSG